MTPTHPHTAVAAIMLLLISGNVIAGVLDDEKYAHPAGEDSYGTVYDAKVVPSELTEVLNDDGQYVLPSFIDLTVYIDENEFWVTNQSFAPETVFTGEQQQTVELFVTDGVNTDSVKLPITLVDRTAPWIDVTFASDVTPQTSFGGLTRYVLPSAVLPVAAIDDNVDAQQLVEATLNGQTYTIGMPVTDEGLHVLQLIVTDAAGNVSTHADVFEIRPRPSYTGAAVVESMSYETNEDNLLTSIDATLLVSASEFDHMQMDLGSVRLILGASDGSWLQVRPIPIMDAFPPGCIVFDHLHAAAESNTCYWRLQFSEDFASPVPGGAPTRFDLIGVGRENDELAFEWGARSVAAVDPDPHQTIIGIIGRPEPCGDLDPPDPQPPLPCEVVDTWVTNWPPVQCRPATTWPVATNAAAGACRGSGNTSLSAGLGYLTGESYSNAEPWFAGTCDTAAPPCAVAHFAARNVQLVGECCDCQITIDASASLTAAAHVASNGNDSLTSGNASTSSTILMGTFECSPSVTLTITASHGPGEGSTIATPVSDTLNCVHPGCEATFYIKVDSAVSSDASATRTYSGPYPIATAVGSTAGSVTSSVNATYNPCEPENGCD